MSAAPPTGFFAIASRRQVVITSLRIAAVVGVVLNVLNYGPVIVAGDALPWPRLVLNFCVPFCVATYSAVRNEQRAAASRREPA
ncbi:MAG: nitrate/nitrite transporter NrtS [Nannocystaceae bacterium]|nr:nitrate/nitrite transporter NrtS [Nannocystaceae bacterium]